MNVTKLVRLSSTCLGFAIAVGVVAFSFALRADRAKGVDRDKTAALREVSLVRWSLPKDGRASAITLTIRNQNEFDVRDLAITCKQVTKAGNVITEEKTIQDEIKAGTSRVITLPSTALKLSAGALVSCELADLEIQPRHRIAVVTEAKSSAP